MRQSACASRYFKTNEVECTLCFCGMHQVGKQHQWTEDLQPRPTACEAFHEQLHWYSALFQHSTVGSSKSSWHALHARREMGQHDPERLRAMWQEHTAAGLSTLIFCT